MAASGPSRPQQLLVLSAKSESALDQATQRLAAALKQQPDVACRRGVYLGTGPEGVSVPPDCGLQNVIEAIAQLESHDRKQIGVAGSKSVVFMFPGQGAQHVRMGAELYESEPLFKRHVDECTRLNPC